MILALLVPESFLLIAVLIVSAAYYTISVSVWSATIGKRAVGIHVLRPDGSRVGPGIAFARYLAYILLGIVSLVGFFMIAFRQDKRGLHDLICDTVVVYKR